MDNILTTEPLYLAPISAYKIYANTENTYFDITQQYQKKSLKNRTYILAANGALRLSIPLIHQGIEHRKYADIKISYAEKWQKDHWNSIISAYRRSPFFEFYEDDLKQFYQSEYEYLYQLNIALHNWINQKIDLKKLEIKKQSEQKYQSIIIDKEQTCEPYLQVFSDRFEFQNNLSIIDLLFNLGSKASKNYLLS